MVVGSFMEIIVLIPLRSLMQIIVVMHVLLAVGGGIVAVALVMLTMEIEISDGSLVWISTAAVMIRGSFTHSGIAMRVQECVQTLLMMICAVIVQLIAYTQILVMEVVRT